MSQIITICAWCTKELDASDAPSENKPLISHGICTDCADRFFNQNNVDIIDFLDRIDAPVVIVNKDGAIVNANIIAKNKMNLTFDQNEYEQGDIIECIYASEPEGCGNTIHCSGCKIRKTIMDTIEHGRSHENVPAYINRGSSNKVRQLDFVFSTEKVNEIVLLRIDKMGKE